MHASNLRMKLGSLPGKPSDFLLGRLIQPPRIVSSMCDYFCSMVFHEVSVSIPSAANTSLSRSQLRPALQSVPTVMRDRELGEPKSHPITVFSLELGAVPGHSTSLYCRHCHTRYYPGFYVHHHATVRTFYISDAMPEFIHTSEHFYTTSDLCELFANMMVTAWTSGTNCARIYNTSIFKDALESALPLDWQTSFQLDVEDVWNTFYTYSLRLDYHEHQELMELPHDAPSQAERLRALLEVRNSRMAGTGQEEWNHACDVCCYMYLDPESDEDEPRYLCIHSAVTDGITMGHPCCGIMD
ncbi:hypothetical protein B0H17DRAFT_677228 [Mycena rosella]|uniref:CxC5 like cysteine cluster associated with KDZ domain-containing protein n=1 Tax=Mycena rosella TaxID=1033263 RepID=A0AAD7DCA6_MYCRO|nr:hypothetical protein B0H17DRAFT_677228 [Mycena rosella]